MNKPNKYVINLIEIFLIVITPFVVIGFNFLEEFGVLKHLTGLTSAERTSNYSLATQWNTAEKTMIYPDNTDYNSTWELIEKNYNGKLPTGKPTFISRFAVNNAPYAYLPDNDGGTERRKKILTPGGVPIAIGFCQSDKISECDVKIIGTLDDLRSWVTQEEKSYKFRFDLLISLISILLGLYLHKTKYAREGSN